MNGKDDFREILKLIRQCVKADRFRLIAHFRKRMNQRGFFWSDLSIILDHPKDVRYDGLDKSGRDRWIVAGEIDEQLSAELVCVMEEDEQGNWVFFITVYWIE